MVKRNNEGDKETKIKITDSESFHNGTLNFSREKITLSLFNHY